MAVNDVFDSLNSLFAFFSGLSIHLGYAILPMLLNSLLLKLLVRDGLLAKFVTFFEILPFDILDGLLSFLEGLLLLLVFGLKGV